MRTILFIFLIILMTAIPVSAAQLQGQSFQDELVIENTTFHLKGLGLKTYFFVKVFVAGFYLEKEVPPLEDVAKRLEVAYFYNIPGDKLAVETKRRMRLNTTAQEFEKIKTRVKIMDGYFVDLKVGDRYALTYLPKIGTQFSYNGKVVGIIEGADFARALFAVWVGPQPISASLKENLLGQ